MTISTTARSVNHDGNGVAKDFTYPFKIAAAEDLRVYLKQGTTYTLKSLGTDYSVSGVGVAGGGLVSFVLAPDVGTANVRVLRRTALTQLADYITNDDFPAEIHEAALDKLTMALQDRADEAMATDESGTYWDAKNVPIRNVGTAGDDGDLLTKGVADGLYGAAAQQAATSAALAAASATAANSAKVAAQAAAQLAGAATSKMFRMYTGSDGTLYVEDNPNLLTELPDNQDIAYLPGSAVFSTSGTNLLMAY